MIDWNKTEIETGFGKEYFDKYPNSAKKVFKICDNYKICHDSGKWISYQNKSNLCGSCAHIGKKRKPFTEEHKANMRKNHADFKGENHPMFGKHLSDEHKENISKANKGRKLSDESRKNISNGHKGLITSEETKMKISKTNKGKKRSKEFCESVSGKNNPMYGKKYSKEERKKISNRVKGKNNPMYGKTGELSPIFGEKNKMFGKHHSKESRIKSSCTKRNISIEDFGGFVGRAPNREHVLDKRMCIKLNSYFEGSNFHHIMSGVGIYIPKDIHRSICHNLKNNYKIQEINKLSFNFLIGDY